MKQASVVPAAIIEANTIPKIAPTLSVLVPRVGRPAPPVSAEVDVEVGDVVVVNDKEVKELEPSAVGPNASTTLASVKGAFSRKELQAANVYQACR